MNGPFAQVALQYAELGWPVFPLYWPTSFGDKKGPNRARCACHDTECDKQGKHPLPTNGLNAATVAPAVIEAWSTRWPKANIGIATGHAFDVVDFDSLEAIDELNSRFADMPPVDSGPMALTGLGIHCLTLAAAPREGRKNCGSAMAGIVGLDYRGTGGYIVAPPSIHYTGATYRWVDGRGPGTPIVDPPAQWLLEAPRHAPPAPAPATFDNLVGRPQRPRDGRGWVATVEGLCRTVATAAEGTRNNVFSWAVWKLLNEHAPAGMPNVAAAVDAVVAAGRHAGLGEGEMRACLVTATRKAGVAA